MDQTPTKHRAKCLCIDIETARHDQLKLREIGVYRPDLEIRLKVLGKSPSLAADLNKATEGAAFVLGHNIIAFDQPTLSLLQPGLALHRLPLVDTLELSPMAFPQNPYHRLVKDYKLCTTTRNDPVRDAELAYELFLDQADALRQRVADYPDEALCLHYLSTTENGTGVGKFWTTIRKSLRPSLEEAQMAWRRAAEGKVCITGQQQVIQELLGDPHWHKSLAYVLAWLRVAGGNSVLPPWVGHAFPETRQLITLLRDVPCAEPECNWCQETHDLNKLLPRYFSGITAFRPEPKTPEGESLQETIVTNGFAGIPTLAILPTGGGKSLCYQLPALARFYRNGSLTVIISPLQSLMKDQVDNLEARGITCAGYLNSLLNPLERRAMLDKLRLGDLGLIFVAPEQFRSSAFANALAHREVGAWVFDEAHCLSKWGHDFRPDYLYVSRFIKNRQKDQPSPVFCFTATAKLDVIEDIISHFQTRLGVTLTALTGGVNRVNLAYEVYAVPKQAKFPEMLRLLEEALKEAGGAIVFCARQKTVEEVADFLKQANMDCGYFHGGMLPEQKRAVQEAFIAGELRVIAATNAFGMGVDKADVRLVIHLDTPGSLENYLQEAGRAGRDQSPARCVLLYDETDLDVQFRLLRNSRLSQHDIYAILKALRSIEKKDRSEGSVVVTSGEILLEIPDKHGIDPDAADADTKVRIAVSWLEEARLLERQENHTRLFPGSLQVANLDEARTLLTQKLGPNANLTPYLDVLGLLLNSEDEEGVTTDELMLATQCSSHEVIQLLRDLDRFQLLSNDNEIGVTLYREPDTAQRLENLSKLENALIDCLREEAPDADREQWQLLHVRRLCDSLRRKAGVGLEPDRLTRLLKSFAEPFGHGPIQRGCFALRPAGQEFRSIKLLRSWQDIETIRQRRMRMAQALLNIFLTLREGNTLLVTCKQGALETTLKADLTLQELEIKDWQAALSSALLYLDSNEVLHLARGKAIFRTAMNIQLNADARRRQFKKSDYAELALHYKDKIIQVHVIAEYARLALEKIQAAMTFIFDYFGMERDEFVRNYFAGRQDILDIATTEAAHRRILVDLKNPDQQAIVAAPLESNHLVLAGPGSGKTRVIVHRVAWLLRECLVMPEDIMVLTYNRSAATEVRRRLWNLVGDDAAGLTILTLHGLAMRITGTSYAIAAEHGEKIEFSDVIKRATACLTKTESDEEAGTPIQRDRLLAGLRYLLVDEYQDINEEHYQLISALAGRTLSNEDDRLSIMVVGDDDQNIYAFGGANVQFIQRFTQDYQAKTHYLIENYRSTGHIINCANRVIAPLRDRMKTDQTIRVNHARREQPDGGDWQRIDPLTQGRVHILEVPADPIAEAQVALGELKRLNQLATGNQHGYWGRFAVIARHWKTLEPLAMLCRQAGIPARLDRDGALLDLHTTREGYALLSLLKNQNRKASKRRMLIRWGVLSRWFRYRYRQPVTEFIPPPYQAMLAQFILETESLAPSSPHIAADLIERLYEFGNGNQVNGKGHRHAPLLLTTAHRAKGLEFDHVLVLDGGGWQKASDDERRLYYVAMSRAKKTLTLCAKQNSLPTFIKTCADLCIRSKPELQAELSAAVLHKTWLADPSQVVLSWPGYFSHDKPLHLAISQLEYGSELALRFRHGDKTGWELIDAKGFVVGRMAVGFKPPSKKIVSVHVAAIQVRHKKPSDYKSLKCCLWEVVLPLITYSSDESNASSKCEAQTQAK